MLVVFVRHNPKTTSLVLTNIGDTAKLRGTREVTQYQPHRVIDEGL